MHRYIQTDSGVIDTDIRNNPHVECFHIKDNILYAEEISGREYSLGKVISSSDERDDLVEKIKIKYFNKDVAKISKIKNGDWIDLRAAEDVYMNAGEFKLIPLGVGMILPYGYEAHIVPRSSTFKKFGIIQTNHMGVIDNSYSGEEDQWMFTAYALRDTHIKLNDRICQFRIMEKQPEIDFIEVEHLNEKSRGGFGSTGHK